MGLTPNLKDVAWRAMTAYDLKAVEEIAAAVHPGLYDSPQTLAAYQRLYRNGCYLLEIGIKPAGYVLSHPWRDGVALPGASPGGLPDDPDTYYVRDLALLPVARRVGAAGHIVEALAKHAEAEGFATIRLVAVNGSQGFWERHGFALADPPHSAGPEGFGLGARLMVRPLDQA